MEQETIALAWCDNGNVDGKFTQGICDVLLKSGLDFKTTIRSQGNQIARQRERLINYWYNDIKTDWLLWVDSDVVISPEGFKKLWEQKDAKERPIVTGVYFTTQNPEDPLMVPMPTIFNFAQREDGGLGITRIHPMPKNKLIKIDAAGMGYVLMHRSVIERIREKLGDVQFFAEHGRGNEFIGEDIFFYALCVEADIPVWCDTSVTAPHMKRFSFDVHYYDAMFGGKRK